LGLGALGREEFCLGALSLGCGVECVMLEPFCGRVSLERLAFPRVLFPADPPFLAGGVNGRNPSFDLVPFPAVAPPRVELTRASLGDMVGA
jgi:hypothetical protein